VTSPAADSAPGIPETNHGTRHFFEIAQGEGIGPEDRGLVVGCGRGTEALYLYRRLGASITGIDVALRIDDVVHRQASSRLRFLEADVHALPFDDESFDFVFFHHVLEHVADPELSIDEIARILRAGGLLYLGTPNRHRAVGYLGAYGVSVRKQIRWNLADYRDRIRGTFRNELGAHAGFSERELRRMLARRFSQVRWLTSSYLEFKYGGRVPPAVLKLVLSKPLIGVTAPAHYALCTR
jgi:SAM-dependent methyltransferase